MGRMNAHDHSEDSVSGLTTQEAERLLALHGPNALPRSPGRSWWLLIRGVGSEPMFQLLMAAGIIYFVLGDFSDALILMVFVVLSGAISVIQEKRSENILESLRDLSAPRALVVRSGQTVRIPGRDVVPGDRMVLVEGDRIAADGRLVSDAQLMVDESLLTGESEPVAKSSGSTGDAQRVYSSALVVRGRGLAVVTATGRDTEIGKIGASVAQILERPSPLHHDAARLVRVFGILALITSAVVMASVGLSQQNWIDAALAGITVAMGLLPEEFAVVLVVFLAMGAWRISRHQVLTRDRAAIETLGAATVLCTDKTGTLTLNHMTLMTVAIWRSPGHVMHTIAGTAMHDPSVARLLGVAASACDATPSDPMERAIHAAQPPDESSVHRAVRREYRLSAAVMAMTNAWSSPGDAKLDLAMKGAPEAVLAQCDLTSAEIAQVHDQMNVMAGHGLRVLAVASGQYDETLLPNAQTDLRMRYEGLIGLADPLRPGVPQAVCACAEAGIRVVMITGDYPHTAMTIARDAGIVTSEMQPQDVVMTGQELVTLDADALAARLDGIRVFARVQPLQKLQLVQALQRQGHVVAMTGDGINDAPALKAADIGIAMGERGTDVAREAAALVLLNDEFSAIVKAIARGRQIYANLRKAIGFIVSIHVPIAGLAALPVMFGQPMLFVPVHIAFLEMVIDPVSSFVFESQPEDTDLMKQPPRSRQESLYPLRLMIDSLGQGGLGLAILLALYAGLHWLDLPLDQIRSVMFIALVAIGFSIVVLHLQMRQIIELATLRLNRPFLVIAGGTLTLLAVMVFVPWCRELFRFQAIPALWFVAAIIGGFVTVTFAWSLVRTVYRALSAATAIPTRA